MQPGRIYQGLGVAFFLLVFGCSLATRHGETTHFSEISKRLKILDGFPIDGQVRYVVDPNLRSKIHFCGMIKVKELEAFRRSYPDFSWHGTRQHSVREFSWVNTSYQVVTRKFIEPDIMYEVFSYSKASLHVEILVNSFTREFSGVAVW